MFIQVSIKTKKIVTLNAAHFLAGYQGKCANMHGHTYTLEIMASRLNGALIVGGISDAENLRSFAKILLDNYVFNW